MKAVFSLVATYGDDRLLLVLWTGLITLLLLVNNVTNKHKHVHKDIWHIKVRLSILFISIALDLVLN